MVATPQQLKELKTELKKQYDAKVKEIETEYKKQLKKHLEEIKSEVEANLTKDVLEQMTELSQRMEKSFDDKVTELTNVIKNQDKNIVLLSRDLAAAKESLNVKDENILDLNRELGEVKQSLNHISQDTTELDSKIKNNTAEIQGTVHSINSVKIKANDLEDRSRRSNLVFFGIPESYGENCGQKICNVLYNCEFYNTDVNIAIDRVHRLGRYKNNAPRPRPIIVKFTYFLEKEYIIRNSSKLYKSKVNVSEDYCRATLDIHKALAAKAKKAKEEHVIKNFQIRYKRVSVQLANSTTERPVYKTYDLQFIQNHPNDWFNQTPRINT